jgi:hypothetical protein
VELDTSVGLFATFEYSINDAVGANDAVAGINVIEFAALAVIATEEVPNNEPVNLDDIADAVNDPSTILDPDINTDPVNW